MVNTACAIYRHVASQFGGLLGHTNEGKILDSCSFFSAVEGMPCVVKRADLIVALLSTVEFIR